MDFLNPAAAAERLNLRIRQLVLESSSAPSPPPPLSFQKGLAQKMASVWINHCGSQNQALLQFFHFTSCHLLLRL